MQKRLSPFEPFDVTLVSVCASAPGSIAERDSSTLIEVEPFFMGKPMASKVSEPVPRGKLQVFDCDASPLHETVPAAVFISKSKVAPVTSSSRFPVPVMVVFLPVVIEGGVKPVIFVCVAPPPQSDQVNFNSAALAAATAAAPTKVFILPVKMTMW